MAAFSCRTCPKRSPLNDTSLFNKTTRDAGLRFENGHFSDDWSGSQWPEPLMRAYSIASANHEEHLEFLTLKCPMAR